MGNLTIIPRAKDANMVWRLLVCSRLPPFNQDSGHQGFRVAGQIRRLSRRVRSRTRSFTAGFTLYGLVAVLVRRHSGIHAMTGDVVRKCTLLTVRLLELG